MLDLNIKALLKMKEQYMRTLSKRNAELQCLCDKNLTVGKDSGHHSIMYAYLSATETHIGLCGANIY